jgi:hypothetical protein
VERIRVNAGQDDPWVFFDKPGNPVGNEPERSFISRNRSERTAPELLGNCMEYSILIHKAEEGGFWSEVPALPGCLSQGETVEETIANTKEAIDKLFSRPIFKTADFITESGIPKQSAHRILRKLTEGGILIVTREGKGTSPAILRFSRLISITETSSR